MLHKGCMLLHEGIYVTVTVNIVYAEDYALHGLQISGSCIGKGPRGREGGREGEHGLYLAITTTHGHYYYTLDQLVEMF